MYISEYFWYVLLCSSLSSALGLFRILRNPKGRKVRVIERPTAREVEISWVRLLNLSSRRLSKEKR